MSLCRFFFTKEFKIINFIGHKPSNCLCTSINEQTNALFLKKDKYPSQIFLQDSNLFKDCQEISNRKLNFLMLIPKSFLMVCNV